MRGSRLPPHTSNRSCRSELESARSSPSVPRGAPQCLHLICVEGGAPSGQSKTMPRELHLMQTILKGECRIGACATCAAFEIVMTCSKPRFETKDLQNKKQSREAEYDGRTALPRETRRAWSGFDHGSESPGALAM